MKNTPDLAPQTGSENRVARNVEIVVNRDPFREIRFGKCQEFHVPFRPLIHPSVLPQKFPQPVGPSLV